MGSPDGYGITVKSRIFSHNTQHLNGVRVSFKAAVLG